MATVRLLARALGCALYAAVGTVQLTDLQPIGFLHLMIAVLLYPRQARDA